MTAGHTKHLPVIRYRCCLPTLTGFAGGHHLGSSHRVVLLAICLRLSTFFNRKSAQRVSITKNQKKLDSKKKTIECVASYYLIFCYLIWGDCHEKFSCRSVCLVAVV